MAPCSLRIFEPHGGRNNLASPLPFAATAARGLRRLTIDCPTHWLDGMECWAELEWKLHCFPQLEVGGWEPGWRSRLPLPRCCPPCQPQMEGPRH